MLYRCPFINDQKCFLFHPKNSFCSQDIYVFVLTFWSCRKNHLIKTLHYWSRNMLNFDILDKGQGIVSTTHFVYDFSSYILLTNQMSFSGCLCYFLRYYSICALQLSVNQIVISSISKLIWSFYSSSFYTWPKKSRKKLKYLENEKLLMWNKKHFSSFFSSPLSFRKFYQTLECTFKPQMLEIPFWITVPQALPNPCNTLKVI